MAHAFFGGIHPADRKALSCEQPITPIPSPKVVVIPMSQHIGAPCQPLVKKGDTVTMGQKIGDGAGLCEPVHASVSGTVLAVEPRPHTNGGKVMSVVIENDGRNTLCPDITPRGEIDDLTPEQKVKLANWIKLTWCSALYQGKAEFFLAEDGKQQAEVEWAGAGGRGGH